MDIRYSEDQLMIQQSARALLAARVTQAARQTAENSDSGYDRALWKEMADLGWLAAAQGGTQSAATLGVLCEEMGRVALASPFLPVSAALLMLTACEPSDGIRALSNAVAAGDAVIVPFTRVLKASRATDGVSLIGAEELVEWAPAANQLLIPIQLEEDGTIALAALDVRRIPSRPATLVDHHRAAFIEIHGVHCSEADILTKAITPTAWSACRDLMMLLAAAAAIGAADGALTLTVDYTKERKQFGRAIGSFQAIQHGLADVKILAEGAWLAVWEGLSGYEHGVPVTGAAPLAAWLALRALQEAAVVGTQYHGGIGYIRDYPMQYFYRLAGASHARLGSQWELLGGIADAYIDPLADQPLGLFNNLEPITA